MNKKLIISIAFVSVFLLTGMSRISSDDNSKTIQIQPVSVRLPWIINNESAGMQVAKIKGYYQKAGLDVTINPGGMGIDPTQLVANGSDTFGVIDSVSLIHAASRDLPIKGIAATFQKTALGIVTINPDIHTFSDLKGKKIGRQPVQEFIVDIMLASANLKLSDIQGVSIGFDMTPLLEGKIDAQIAYVSGQPVELRKMDKSPVFFPGNDHGYKFYGNVIVSGDNYLKKHPKETQMFLQATALGWEDACQDLDSAVDIILTNQPDLERESQREGLNILCQLAFPESKPSHKTWGRMKSSTWENSVKSLKMAGKLDKDVSTSSIVWDIN